MTPSLRTSIPTTSGPAPSRMILDRDARGAVLAGVGGEVRQQLGEEIPIPAAGHVAFGAQPDRLFVDRLQLVDDRPGDLGQVDARALDRKAPAQADAGEVEQLGDHPFHPVGAGHHPARGAGDPFGVGPRLQEPRRGGDRREGIAKVVAEDAGEHLAEVDGALHLGDARLALALGQLLRRHVGHRHQDALVGLVVGREGHRERDVDRFAGQLSQRRLADDDPLAGGDREQDLAERARCLRDDQVAERADEMLGARRAEHPQRGGIDVPDLQQRHRLLDQRRILLEGGAEPRAEGRVQVVEQPLHLARSPPPKSTPRPARRWPGTSPRSSRAAAGRAPVR